MTLGAGLRAAIVAGCAISVACFPPTAHSTPEATALIVRNTSDYDINVYAVRDASSIGARLGTVFAHDAQRLSVRRSQVAIDNTLTVAVHAVGVRGSWTSPSLMLVEGMFSALEVRSGASADFSPSVFQLVNEQTAMRLLRR